MLFFAAALAAPAAAPLPKEIVDKWRALHLHADAGHSTSSLNLLQPARSSKTLKDLVTVGPSDEDEEVMMMDALNSGELKEILEREDLAA